MTTNDPHIRRPLREGVAETVPRRGRSSACLSLLSGVRVAASAENPPPQFLLEWGRRGKGEGEFDACVGIAIGKNDEVYTAEFRNQRVQKFTPEGQFLGAFPVQPHAGGLAVDPEGNVYVAHWNSNKVAAYSPSGKLLREWGRKGTGDGEFQLPGSVALGPDGLLYVPDQGNSRVQKFTREGKFVGKWGEHGKEPGQFGGGQPAGGRFAGPQFVAFDRAGNVYTTDAALDRVQKFTPEGKLLAFWGSGECRARRVRASPAQQGRYTGHGRPHRAVRGPAGPGLGQCHEQPRPAVHERGEVPARPGRGGHRARPLPPAAWDGVGQPRLPVRRGYDERPDPEVCYCRLRQRLDAGLAGPTLSIEHPNYEARSCHDFRNPSSARLHLQKIAAPPHFGVPRALKPASRQFCPAPSVYSRGYEGSGSHSAPRGLWDGLRTFLTVIMPAFPQHGASVINCCYATRGIGVSSTTTKTVDCPNLTFSENQRGASAIKCCYAAIGSRLSSTMNKMLK